LHHTDPVMSARLRLCRFLPLALCLFAVSCASSPTDAGVQSGDTPEIARARDVLLEARKLNIDGDPEGALNQLDKIWATHGDLPDQLAGELMLVAGEANYALAQAGLREGDRSATMTEGCFADAEDSLRDAFRRLTKDARPGQLLAEVYQAQGKWADALDAANQTLARLEALDLPIKERLPVLLLRGKAELRQLIDMRRPEREAGVEPADATTAKAQSALVDFALVLKNDPRSMDAYLQASFVHDWMGRPGDAIAIVEDGIRALPADFTLHSRLRELYLGNNMRLELAGFYSRLAREFPRSAEIKWSQGIARLYVAQEKRQKGDRPGAERSYEAAIADLAESKALKPEFAKDAAIQQALCKVSEAAMALDDGDEKGAEQRLDEAYAITPDITARTEQGADRYVDGSRRSYANCVHALGTRFGQSRLEEGRRYWRKITARHADWGWAWNNLGLACRDLGARVARSDAAAAKKLWEESYAAYEQAVKYAPDDARTANDCGLMLVYHLHRDAKRAEALFNRAIEIGKGQLADLGPKADEEDEATRSRRESLEEAVGDAYQNLGKLYADELQQPKQAIHYYKQALDYWSPSNRRDVRDILRKLESEHGDKKGYYAPHGQYVFATVGPLPVFEPPACDDDTLVQAWKRIEASKPEAALDLVEPLLEKRPKDPEVWYVAGHALLRFSEQLLAQRDRSAEANLIDAGDRLAKAESLVHEMDAGTPLFGTSIHIVAARDLIRTRVLQGRAAEAWKFGERYLTHLDSTGLEFEPAAMASLMIEIADAAVRKVVADVGAGNRNAKEITSARAILGRAAAQLETLAGGKSRLDPTKLTAKAWGRVDARKVFEQWKNLELWLERPIAAQRVLARGARLLSDAEAGVLLGELCAVVAKHGDSATALEQIASVMKVHGSNDPTLLWYRGYAQVLAGNECRIGDKAKAAPDHYAKARKDFEAAMRRGKQSFADSSTYWIAFTHVSEGWMAFDNEDIATAKAQFLQALTINPRVAATDDALGRSCKTGLLALAQRHIGRGRMSEGLKLLSKVHELLPNDLDVCNNLALTLRDHAVSLERAGSTAKAKQMYTRSYELYKKALALAPDNVRLLNDTALIDVHYLHKHLDDSEKQLRKAIEIGDGQLELGEPEDAAARRDLEVAVGDAYMNLGVLLMLDDKRLDEARKVLTKSLEYAGQRSSRRHLQELERRQRK